jgi:hypothetical protein
MKKTIPRKDADFDVWQETITSEANRNIFAWYLDYEWMDNELAPPKRKWESTWANYKDAPRRSRLMSSEKQKARQKYEAALRILVQNLTHNINVNDEERVAMGIALPAKNSKSALIGDRYPDCTVKTSLPRCVTVYFHEHGSRLRVKPVGMYGAEMRWIVMNTLPRNISELIYADFATSSPFRLEFGEEERGKIVRFCLRWISNSGEKGQWSEVVSAVIP